MEGAGSQNREYRRSHGETEVIQAPGLTSDTSQERRDFESADTRRIHLDKAKASRPESIGFGKSSSSHVSIRTGLGLGVGVGVNRLGLEHNTQAQEGSVSEGGQPTPRETPPACVEEVAMWTVPVSWPERRVKVKERRGHTPACVEGPKKRPATRAHTLPTWVSDRTGTKQRRK